MRILLAMLLVGFFAVSAIAGKVSLEPQTVVQGGVLMLTYTGDPPRFAVTRLFDRALFLHETEQGGRRLLGVALTVPPGRYDLPVRVETSSGLMESFELSFIVAERESQVERLTLPTAMVSPKKPALLARIKNDAEQLNTFYSLNTPPRLTDQFMLPVSDQIGSRFGLKRILNGKPRSAHTGVDFRSPGGRQIVAPAPAVVVAAEDYYYTGKTVVLDHGGGLLSVFAHLQSVAVVPGDKVTIGEVLGQVGSTGRSTGPHLHWSTRLNQDRVDPLALFELFNGEKP